MQPRPNWPHRSRTRSNAHMAPPNPAKSSCFRRAHLPSTCSKATTEIGVPTTETKPQTSLGNIAAAPKTTARSQSKVLDSGKVYVVAKGDNPVTIAKKFKVSYDDLLALNHIDDPHKLKIGQKLLIPDKIKTTKKGE